MAVKAINASVMGNGMTRIPSQLTGPQPFAFTLTPIDGGVSVTGYPDRTHVFQILIIPFVAALVLPSFRGSSWVRIPFLERPCYCSLAQR